MFVALMSINQGPGLFAWLTSAGVIQTNECTQRPRMKPRSQASAGLYVSVQVSVVQSGPISPIPLALPALGTHLESK